MDKLRGMEYLARVVEERGFARAARGLDVSPPAVTQMISALERSLGTTLLRRTSKGLSLTPDGEQYYQLCVQTLARVHATEAQLRSNRMKASGVLVVGMSRIVARNCIMPHIAEFFAQHPDVHLDIRSVQTIDEPGAAQVDVLLINAWREREDMIGKHLAQTQYLTCASPAYWHAHGIARDPEDLRDHTCITYRSSFGLVLDEWKYRRSGVVKTIAINSQLICDDQDATNEAAVGGLGVIRSPDLMIWPWLERGLLVPVLSDWETLDSVPVRLLYRRSVRSSARVRAFSAFATDTFLRLRKIRSAAGGGDPGPQPIASWYRKKWVGALTRTRGQRTGPRP